jgi:hypothetical protein
MHEFSKCFRRESPGVWTCVMPAMLQLPEGRVQVASGTRLKAGTKFMNVDVAALLDEYARLHVGESRAP